VVDSTVLTVVPIRQDLRSERKYTVEEEKMELFTRQRGGINRTGTTFSLLVILLAQFIPTAVSFTLKTSPPVHSSISTKIQMVTPFSEREAEIRRKILKLKRQGKIKPRESSDLNTQLQRPTTSATDDYSDQIKAKLGRKKASMLGFVNDENDELDDIEEELEEDDDRLVGQLGSLPKTDEDVLDVNVGVEDLNVSDNRDSSPAKEDEKTKKPIIDPSLFDVQDDKRREDDDLEDEDLVDIVARKLSEQRQEKTLVEEEKRRERLSTRQQQTTRSGVGGTWTKPDINATAQVIETYKPKTGSWGAFERPKDISKAYGGGRRVGAGIDQTSLLESTRDTRERLQKYREKVGIDVQSEKDHAADIEEALKIAGYAMQRGMYSTAVSALEKVTKYCSTNSKVGGKVFLELAMAYEAEGRTQEAVTVYTTLSKSRMEEIKFDAKRLLYGIEAMQFMRNEAKLESFGRKKIRNTFIDTTGLDHFSQHFDDVYETAYIDLSSGFYRRLTESVVRSNREARQILLQARGSGMVEHLKIVQALKSLSRHFDSALIEEQKAAAPQSVAVMDGKPIVARPERQEESSVATVMAGMDEFILASPEEMLEMLDGKWRLQLVADRQGDGVKYNNNSTLQTVDTNAMKFTFTDPSSFVKVSQSGSIEFDSEKRILSKTNVSGGGGVLSGLISGGKSNILTGSAQQIVSVDSVLLVTRLAPDKKRSVADGNKGYFSVWRRV
jgi:hypothetical protein